MSKRERSIQRRANRPPSVARRQSGGTNARTYRPPTQTQTPTQRQQRRRDRRQRLTRSRETQHDRHYRNDRRGRRSGGWNGYGFGSGGYGDWWDPYYWVTPAPLFAPLAASAIQVPRQIDVAEEHRLDVPSQNQSQSSLLSTSLPLIITGGLLLMLLNK